MDMDPTGGNQYIEPTCTYQQCETDTAQATAYTLLIIKSPARLLMCGYACLAPPWWILNV